MRELLRVSTLRFLRLLIRLTGYHGFRVIRPLTDRLAPGRPLVVSIDGSRVLLDLTERYNFNLFFKGTRTIEELGAFHAAIRPGMTVLDIGANIGIFTLAAARLVGPAGRVVAFEPHPRNFRFLAANVALNGFTNVILEQAAVAEDDRPLELQLFGTDNLSLSPAASGHGSTGTLRVSCLALDRYLVERRIEDVGVIKLDVEGAEMAALRGMARLLENRWKPTLVVEVHPDLLRTSGSDARDVLALLETSGYRLTHLIRAGDAGRPIPTIENFEIPYQAGIAPMNRFRILCEAR